MSRQGAGRRPGGVVGDPRRFDRAALALGAVSLVSTVFAVARGDPWELVHVRGPAIAVALALGALAVAAGWLGRRRLAAAAGAGFILGALAQLVLLPTHPEVLQGNGSTVSLWLGLGVGLLVVGTVRTAE